MMSNKINQNIPKLRFHDFNDEWEEVNIQDAGVQIIDGDRGDNYPNRDDFSEQGFCLFLNAKNVTSAGFSFNECLFINSEKDKQLRKGKLARLDLVLTTRGTVGNVAYYDQSVEYDHIRINSGMVLLRTSKSKILPEYLYKFTNSRQFSNQILHIAFGSAQPQLTVSGIAKLKLTIPSKEEQQKIASFLTAIDEWLENLQQQKENLEKYKKVMMQKIFSQEIRFKDKNGKDLPEWIKVTLGEAIAFLSDYTANGSFASLKENVRYYSSEDFAVLVRATDLEKVKFTPERFTDERGYKFLKKTSLHGGELIMSNVGNIGKVYKAPFYHMPMTLAPNTYLIKFNKEINNEYMYQWMRTKFFMKHVLSKVGGGGLTAINKSNLRSIIFYLPKSIVEQQKIADFLSSIDNLIDTKQNQITLAEEWKRGLMQQMFV